MYALVDFYEAYRACVRAKVAALVVRDEGIPEEQRVRAASDARRYVALAVSADRPLLLKPSVTVVGGVIASGKSTIAETIARELGAPAETPIERASTCSAAGTSST